MSAQTDPTEEPSSASDLPTYPTVVPKRDLLYPILVPKRDLLFCDQKRPITEAVLCFRPADLPYIRAQKRPIIDLH